MASPKRKQDSVEPTVETFNGESHESIKAPTSSTSVDLDDTEPDRKQARATKKFRTNVIAPLEVSQQNRDNFGTATLQRPQRSKRPPERYQDNTVLLKANPRRGQKRPSSAKRKLSQNSTSQKPSTRSTLPKSRNKYGFLLNGKTSTTADDVLDDKKYSCIVSHNVGSDHLDRLAAPQEQDVPLPSTLTPAPAEGGAPPDHDESNPAAPDQKPMAKWAPHTPRDSPKATADDERDIIRTPQWVISQAHEQPAAPLTPTSGPRCNVSKLLLPELSKGDLLRSPPSIVDSEATTVYEDVPEPSIETSELDQLRALAERLTRREVGKSKPCPAGVPEVWADGRQELCETLHYYRAYQSACYSTGGFVRGFMFDKVAHPRDYIDSNVVISRAGGGQMKDKDTGELRMGRDQVEDSVAQNLRNCKNHYNPVVIIAGVDNPHFPSQSPHQYCVMDYFKPTHIWFEKDGKSKIVRYRFEKLNAKKQSWWRPEDSDELVELDSLSPPNKQTCHSCGRPSTQIYLNGWMCLQPSCRNFWKIRNRKQYNEPEQESLIYDPRFLKQKTLWPNDDHEYSLTSNKVELSGHAIPGEDTSQAFWLGSVCPDCGRCNSRLSWMGWQCGNPACSFRKAPPHTLIPALSLREPLWPVTSSYTLSRDIQSPLISVRVTFTHGYRINRYSIPGINGFITHMIANKTVLEEAGGPDSMFEELQQTDIGLRRHPMPNGQLKGANHCRHFTVNYGMPYKFIAATSSHSFDNAARPITATRSRLNWAAQLLHSQEPETTAEPEPSSPGAKDTIPDGEFNEVLALGYFESQKINFHDDGEFGLGPTIATLSLGAPGTMRIRMKSRHYNGVSASGIYDDAPPLPGCRQYEDRAALQPGLEALRRADPKAYAARRKQIPRELGLTGKGNAKEVLSMQLAHGDVVVMHGRDVQRYYEHAVEHAGKLRFALTCRYVDPESLQGADRPGYEVGPDGGGYDGSGLV